MHHDILDFRLLVNIAESSSLSKGAERSFLSVPAASNRLKNLEDRLGVKLLHRSVQGMTLTDAGRTYLRHARQVLAQLELLNSDLQEFGLGVKGRLKIFANTTAVTEFLPHVVGEFLRTHPHVQIDLRERMSDDTVRGVRDGVADLGIISGMVVTEGLQTVPLTSSRLLVITPSDHELASQESVHFKDILKYEFVSLMAGSATHEFLMQIASSLHVPMHVRVQVAGYDPVFRMVESGVGISVIPEMALQRLNVANTVKVVQLLDPWAGRDFQLCATSFFELPTFAREFADMLLAQFKTSRKNEA